MESLKKKDAHDKILQIEDSKIKNEINIQELESKNTIKNSNLVFPSVLKSYLEGLYKFPNSDYEIVIDSVPSNLKNLDMNENKNNKFSRDGKLMINEKSSKKTTKINNKYKPINNIPEKESFNPKFENSMLVWNLIIKILPSFQYKMF